MSHNIGNLVQGEHPKNSDGIGVGSLSQQKTCNISETGQDRTKVTINDQQEVAYTLSIGAKINDLGWSWRAIMHMRLSEPTTKILMKIGP